MRENWFTSRTRTPMNSTSASPIRMPASCAHPGARSWSNVTRMPPGHVGSEMLRTVAFSVPCSTILPARISGSASLIWLAEIA